MSLLNVDEGNNKGKRRDGGAPIAWRRWAAVRLPVMTRNMMLSTAVALMLNGPAQATDRAPLDATLTNNATQVEADNTRLNLRDRDGATLTPMDQSADPKDFKITQNIRQRIVADDSLGVTAHNIKVITIKGRVTLRGPVATTSERARIVNVAEQIAGTKNVTDELEVAVR